MASTRTAVSLMAPRSCLGGGGLVVDGSTWRPLPFAEDFRCLHRERGRLRHRGGRPEHATVNVTGCAERA
jgi:hypothetical protein